MPSISSVLALLSLTTLVAPTSCAASNMWDISSIIAHTGTPIGTEQVYDGINLYITGPKTEKAVLFLTDVFGISLNQNRLLADSFGRAGFYTVMPDLFDGNPAPEDIDGTPGFNTTEFLAAHEPPVTDPKIAKAIEFMKSQGVTKIGAPGYCFGGRYAFRFVAEGKGVDAAFAAHPSLLTDAEILAITKPATIAAAETDALFNDTRRHDVEALLLSTNLPYTMDLYSGTSHGFGARANVSDPEQKYGKEQAFVQACRWFSYYA